MPAEWKRPARLGLSDKLQELTLRLRELIPQLVEAQGEAVKRMAETAVAAQPQAPRKEDHA